MAKVNYRKLVNSPGFDFQEMVRELAYTTTMDSKQGPPVVTVGGRESVIIEVGWDQSPTSPRESQVKIGFLALKDPD
jgi:hypothetical protein